MSEHDDDLPPELDIGPQLFKFRQISELKIASFTEKPHWKFVRTSALAVANEFGATFVGVPTGIKVLSSSSLLKSKSGDNSSQHEIASIALRKQPTWIDVSSDNLTLSVCCCSEEGIQILYFDMRNIFNKAKAVKTPFHQSFLSKSKDITVTSLMWNPSKEFAHLLALSLSNGRLYVISVKDSNPTILKDASIDASVVSWNIDGSELLVGKKDGALCQLNQNTYDMEQSVSVSNVIDGEVRTCDLLWISDCDVATVFTPSGDDDTPKLVLAKLPEKNKFSDIAWKDYDEPSSGFGESRPTQLYLKLIKDWDLFVYVSSNSNAVVIIGKNKTTSVWEIWNLEEYCRAAVPISKYNDEDMAAIGVSVITGHEGTQPVLAVFTDDCILCLFEIVNCMDGYPNIVNQVSVPDLKDERVAVKIQDVKISSSSSEQPAPTFQKQKLTAKPSVFSSIKPLDATSIKPLGVPSIKPLGVPSIKPLDATSIKPLGVPSIKPLGVPQGFSQIPKLALSKVAPIEKSSAPMSTRFNSSSPLLSKLPTTQPVQSVQPASKQSKVPFLPSKPTIVSSGSDEPKAKSSTLEHTKSKIPSLSRQRDLPVKIKHQPDVKSTMREISEFEEELQQVQSLSEDTKKIVDKMLEQRSNSTKLQQLSQFQQEIRDTTADLEHEIEDLSTELFTLLSDAKQATQKKLLKSDCFYKEMMYNKPLNQTQRRQYSDLLNLYRYVVTSSQEANTLLDYQWQNNEGVGSSQKTGRKGKAREWESARQALVSNMKVFHDLQVKILRLSQQIDRLQISKRIALSDTMAALSPRSSKFTGRSPRSQLLVSGDGDGDGPKNKGTASIPDLLAPEKKLSALKQHKLGKVLAQRDNKRIIRADLSKASILRSVNKRKSSESCVTPSSESELANDGTTSPSTETEGQEYSETDESSEEPETTIKTAYEPPPPISMTPQGSATLAYGAPKSLEHAPRPFSKPFNLAANKESKMNLNNPPQVVNIQNVAKPIYKGPPLMQKFEPKPDVPSGAVEVVQSVLETVKAEKAKPVPENWKFINQGKGEGAGEDVNEKQPEPTTSMFQMKLPQSKSLFFSADKAASSPPPPSYPFSTLSKTSSQPEVGVFEKPQPKEPAASEASTSQSLGLKLQTPSTKSIFNIEPFSSKPSGSNLFSGAPLFSSTPSVFSMERKTLFSAPSPVPTSTSETSSSDHSTPSDSAAPPMSSPISVPATMPATVKAQTPTPSSVPGSESPTGQSPSTPPIASSKPATPPVIVPSVTPSPILHTAAVSSSAVVSSSPSTPIPALTSDATSSTEVTVTEQTQSQNADEPGVVTDPAPPTPEPEPTPAISSSTAPVLPSVTTASPLPSNTEAISVSDHPFGTSSAQFTTPSLPTQSDLEVKSSQSAPSPFQTQTSSFNTGSIFSSSQSNPTASTTSGFGGFGSLSVGDKPAIPGPSKNPFQTAFGADSTTNEEKPSVFGQMSHTSVSSPFGSANKPSQNTSQSNLFGTPTTQSSFSSFTSPTNSGVGSQGFGGFGKSSIGGFGGPAKFGGTPSFGSSSSFGGASRTFGSGFGTSTFGTAAAPDQNKGFAGFGSGGASSGFGTMGNQGGNSVFGSFGNQGGSTFGSIANQSGSSGFGALAAQGGSNQGASPFGGMANQNTSSGFGAQPSQGNTSVFGSLGNQGNSTGFGGLASQGTTSGFGGNISVFGNNGNNQSGSTGFGAFGNQGGSSLGGFGGMQQNQSGGFGMKSDQSPSFSSWR